MEEDWDIKFLNEKMKDLTKYIEMENFYEADKILRELLAYVRGKFTSEKSGHVKLVWLVSYQSLVTFLATQSFLLTLLKVAEAISKRFKEIEERLKQLEERASKLEKEFQGEGEFV